MSFLGIRFALRSLGHSKGFTAIAVISLGLALAVTTITFALLDGVVHPYVPIRDAAHVFYVWPDGDGAHHDVTGFQKYTLIRDDPALARGCQSASRRSPSSAGDDAPCLAMFTLSYTSVAAGSAVANRSVAGVTSNYFSLLGVPPTLGRAFAPGDGAGHDRPAIVSQQLWATIPSAKRTLGKATVMVDETSYTIVGVMPPGVDGPYEWNTDVWIPLSPTTVRSGVGLRYPLPIIRVSPGTTENVLLPHLAVLESRLTSEFGKGRRPFQYVPVSMAIPPTRNFSSFHVALTAAAVALLLIACANLANLMLARALVRRWELALRMALGATRATIVRELVTECAIIALAGAALGVLVTTWSAQTMASYIPRDISHVGTVNPTLSWRVFVFALLATAATIVLFGLVPALRASQVDLNEPIKDGAGTTTGRVRNRYSALVIAEVALSMALLMGAGLLARAAHRVSGFDFGYDATHLLTSFMSMRHATTADSDAAALRYDHILQLAQQSPDIRAAATIRRTIPNGQAVLSELPSGGNQLLWGPEFYVVSPDILRTLGIRVVHGRDFEPGDVGGAGAVILDEDAARALWPHEDPVGRLLQLGTAASGAPWVRVVGVAHDAWLSFDSDPDLEHGPAVYVIPPGRDRAPMREVVVRAARNDGAAGAALRHAIESVVPSLTGAGAPSEGSTVVRPWLVSYGAQVRVHDFVAKLFLAFGAFALVLSAVGLYGVLSYAVGQRRRELAVRAALGARSAQLFRLVMHDGFVMVLGGTAVGAVLAMWSAKLLSSWLYGVDPTDATSLVLAEGALFLVSLWACLAPAIRATRADPLEVLRSS